MRSPVNRVTELSLVGLPPGAFVGRLGSGAETTAFVGRPSAGTTAFDQIPKLGCEIDQIHAAFSVGESNFGEVGGGQRKRLLNSGFRCE